MGTNGRKPPPPPPRSGRSTFDGFPCLVWAFAMLGAGLGAVALLAGMAYLIVA